VGLLLLFVGKTKEGFIREGIDKYSGLVRPHLQVEIREIKGARGKERGPAVEEEAESILARIQPSDYFVALDERGINPGSVAFAKELEGLIGTGRRVVFAVGGPFGLSETVRKRADRLLSLSKLTFTHEMARLILLEQLYRAVTIMKHKAYHY
jgi:23S rRNA (pseudouridine1915-N3)-methyltransferase